MSHALFIFAHQDDEYAAAPWIVAELASHRSVVCIYLTDGGANVAPEIRDAESIGVLRSLGVGADGVVFLNAPSQRIRDGSLSAHAAEALDALERWAAAAALDPETIYAPAYEGGHPDHDAAHVIAAAFAAARDRLDACWHFAIYNAYRCPPPFFATLRQLPQHAPVRRDALPLRERWRLAWLCWRYPSQRRTWLGLFPGAFLERVLLARERVVRFDGARLRARPHDGELLYERMFATRYEDVARDLAPLTSALT